MTQTRLLAQASNLGALNGATVDGDNLLATSAHNVVQQGEMGNFDLGNGQFEVPVRGDGNLVNPFDVPHATQAGGAGEAVNENSDAPLEDEAEESEDSDGDDYTTFTAADLLDHLYEYKLAYRNARRH